MVGGVPLGMSSKGRSGEVFPPLSDRRDGERDDGSGEEDTMVVPSVGAAEECRGLGRSCSDVSWGYEAP